MSDARENLEAMSSDYVDVLSEGAAILAGDVIASQSFDLLDQTLLSSYLGSYPNVKKGVNVLGPGVLGAIVFQMTDNSVVEGIAVGHGLTTVRRAVDEGLNYLGVGTSTSEQMSGNALPPASADSLAGRRLAEPGINAAADTAGNRSAEETVTV